MLGLLLHFITPTTILVFTVFLLLTYYILTLPRSINMPPGPFPFPVIGNFHQFAGRPDEGDIHVLQSLARKYGKLFSMKLGYNYAIVISDYNVLVEAFVKKSDVFNDRPVNIFYLMSYINNKLGSGIVTNNGHSWKSLRRTALTTMRDFGVGKLSLEEKIQDEIRVLLEVFSEHNNQPIYTKPLFNLATSNVICQVIFGSRFDYDDEKFKELLRVLDNSLRSNPIFTPVNFFPYLRHIPFFKQPLRNFSRTLLLTSEYVKSLTASNESSFDPDNIRDFVDLFIKMRSEHQQDESYDERSMARVIVDLFTAGSDTTANTLSWAMLYMAKYPEIQKRCQQEIDHVLGKGKLPTLADKEKLPYSEATILEVLRVRPAAPLGVPHCTSKDTEFHGFHIPQNTLVLPNLISMNMDHETFPEPHKFDPGHFLNAYDKVVHRDRMVSFSIGPRSCLGEILAKMELSLFFVAILQFFTISPEPGKAIDMSPVLSLVLRHEVQNLVFTRRKSEGGDSGDDGDAVK